MARKMHESAGLRVVLCTRPDCCHAESRVADEVVAGLPAEVPGGPYFICLGQVLVMDRRVAFGLPCARFGLCGPQKPPT